jgi:hypothetical protein
MKKKTRYKVYDLTFIINEKEYHYIMVCHKVTKKQYLMINKFGNSVNFSIELNPLQTREESEAMFSPMIRNNEYNVRCLTKTLSYKQALKIAKQYKLKYMELCCSLNRNYNITNLDLKFTESLQKPLQKTISKTNSVSVKKIPKKLQNIKNPVLRETLIKRYLKQSKKSN